MDYIWKAYTAGALQSPDASSPKGQNKGFALAICVVYDISLQSSVSHAQTH